MKAVIEQLQQVGFSQYEAQAYIALLRENPLNGYELARASNIPRPNIYPVLQKLEERGAVLRLDSPEGTRYAPLPPDELFTRLERQYQSTLNTAADALRYVSVPQEMNYILNLRGYELLLEHARSLLNSAKDRLLISLWPDEAGALAEPMRQARERGVEITTLCLRGCPQPCPNCQGEVFRFPIAPAKGGRWLVLAADDSELLAGEISSQGEALAVRTRQKMLVNLSGSYIQNSIALASLLNGLGEKLDTLLDPQTLAAINRLHPLQAEGPWLEAMRRVLNKNVAADDLSVGEPEQNKSKEH